MRNWARRNAFATAGLTEAMGSLDSMAPGSIEAAAAHSGGSSSRQLDTRCDVHESEGPLRRAVELHAGVRG